jgi:hypothetical protein
MSTRSGILYRALLGVVPCASLATGCWELGSTAPETPAGCTVDVVGNYVCASVAAAYPYDYAYVDPMYDARWGYYPTAIDTYYDPKGYDAHLYAVLAGSLALTSSAHPSTGSPVPPLLDDARRAAGGVNAGLRAALDPIRNLLQSVPTEAGGTVVYGPAAAGGASYRLTLRTLSSADRHYGWTLESRPPASAGAFATVAGGDIRVGDQPRRGRGVIGVDCDALAAADSTVVCRGKIREGFAHDGEEKLLQVALDAYTPDGARIAPLDARLFAWRRGFYSNAVRLVVRADLAPATTAPETVAIKLLWRRDVGVRADAAASGGDLPPDTVMRASSCVAADFSDAGNNCPPALGGPDMPQSDPTAMDPPASMPTPPDVPPTIPDGKS